jgi:predicted naringenin-chalcone synthase
VLSIDGVHTLVDVVNIKPIRTSLVSHAIFSHGIVAIVVAQVKDDL